VTQLVQLGEKSQLLGARNTMAIAISADTQEKVNETIAKYNLAFPVLSDAGLKVIKRYHVLHPTKGIAMPVTYIIDSSGRIRWRYYHDRPHHPSWEVLLQALETIQRKDGYQ